MLVPQQEPHRRPRLSTLGVRSSPVRFPEGHGQEVAFLIDGQRVGGHPMEQRLPIRRVSKTVAEISESHGTSTFIDQRFVNASRVRSGTSRHSGHNGGSFASVCDGTGIALPVAWSIRARDNRLSSTLLARRVRAVRRRT